MLSTRLAGLSAALLLLLAGCTSHPDEGIATAGGAPRAGVSPSEADFETQMRAYQRCLADHGVQQTVGDSSPITNDPATLEAAMAACRSLLPGGDELANEKPEELEARRLTAQCMRAAGYAKWPDPVPGSGTWKLPREIDLSDPTVKSVFEDCVRKSQPTPEASQ